MAATLMLSGCSSGSEEPTTPEDPEPTGPPEDGQANATGPYPLNLTWYLDVGGRMGPDRPAAGQIELTGGSDVVHQRDLVVFATDPYDMPQQLVNVSVHLILEAPSGWEQADDQIQCWFGFDDDSYPVQVDAPESYTLAANTPLDVRLNMTLPPGGVFVPTDGSPYFLCGIPGSQSASRPLHLMVGGENATSSHIHPRSYNWSAPSFAFESVSETSGSLIPDSSPAGPTSSMPVAVDLPDEALGFRAWVRSGQELGVDFDVEVVDRGGDLIAESNGPRASEFVLFVGFNLEAFPQDLSVDVVNAGVAPGSYTLTIEALVPG